jgi:ArsR family metal-binding transcriptional regulator
MLLSGYTKEVFRPECNPGFTSLHCHAHLNDDVAEVIPYLNAELGGFEYTSDPPSVTFRAQGKLITVHPRLIAVNALKDGQEAERILDWLVREINQAWEGRHRITPSHQSLPRPQVLKILMLLPRTNCRKCGQPTCMALAAIMAEGGKGAEDCPELAPERGAELGRYLAPYFQE